ncbi:MAG: ABC transporter ATP-binding protein [Candidatus Kariarchaeaceae archaeon]|jgi:ABC-type Fe3+/spermidine/putrescine transport system ATPase subunit
MKIELIRISLEFEGDKILDCLDISFSTNKLNCLLGKSGSGKTSVLKIIAGISPSFDGKVYFNGKEITNLPARDRYIGWVPQQQILFPGLDIGKNIAYGLVARGVSRELREKRIAEVADLVGLTGLLTRSPDGLSGGERQRVALARALAPSPQVLLLDEPFSSLDAPERDRLALLFREIQLATGVTTVHVTHSPREAELISDQVFVLSNGKILQYGSMNELYSNPNSIEVARLLSIPNVIEASKFNWLSMDAVIPKNAIKIGTGGIKAKVLSVTKDSIHLLINDDIRIEAYNTNQKIKPGDIISIEFDQAKIVPISNKTTSNY